jgi:hypothetical protein
MGEPQPNISDEELRAFQAQAGDAAMPPTSDAELAAQGAVPPAAGAGLTPPGEIVPPAEMPPGEFGPPAPNPTGPAGGASEPWPPVVPGGAPGAVPPGGAPAALAAEPAGGGEGGATGVQGAMGESEAARKESDEAKIKQHEEETRDTANFRADRVAELQARADEDAARIKANQDARAKSDAEIKAKSDAIAGFKFKDLWADETTGQRVGRIFASALLAIGAGMQKTPKYAMEILDKEREEDHQKQLNNLGLLKDDYVRARTGMEDADLGRQRIAADISLGRARKDDLMAAQFEETAARTKDANAGAYAAQLRADSAKAKQDAALAYQAVNLKTAEAEEKRRLNESQILANEAAARLKDRGLGQGHKAGGGAGGGAGGMNGAGETKLMQKIEEYRAKNGGAMPSQGTIYGWADDKDIRLPHEAKAGHPSVANVIAQAQKLTTTATGETRGAYTAERLKNLEGSLDVIGANGEPLGKAPDAKTASKLRSQVQAYDQFNTRLTALRDYVKEHGPRAWSVDDSQKRDSLGAAAAAAGRVYNGLGGTDASQKLEAMINGSIGTPGHGWWTGSNLDVLNHNLEEAAHQHQVRLNTSLRAGAPAAHAEGGGAPRGKRVKLKDGRTGTLEADGVTFHPDH